MRYVVGIDEVGLGCWAGPVVVAGVVFVLHNDLKRGPVIGLRDSKKLTHPRRMELTDKIKESALYWVIAQSNVNKIDKYGIQACKRACMWKCAVKCLERFPESKVMVDGIDPIQNIANVETIIKGDDKVAAISAASIIAKTHRDLVMIKLAYKYPKYGFERHKGYGSVDHRSALKKFGICEQHRKSYRPIKKLLQKVD